MSRPNAKQVLAARKVAYLSISGSASPIASVGFGKTGLRLAQSVVNKPPDAEAVVVPRRVSAIFDPSDCMPSARMNTQGEFEGTSTEVAPLHYGCHKVSEICVIRHGRRGTACMGIVKNVTCVQKNRQVM